MKPFGSTVKPFDWHRTVRTIFCNVVLAAALAALCANAGAGQRCDRQLATPEANRLAAAAAANAIATLNAQQRPIALIARIGQDLSAQRLLYSHAAFVIADDTTHPHTWQVTHLLNECGSDRGALYREGMLNFYLDSPLSYQSKIVFLQPALEQQLLRALTIHHGKAVFEPRYSVIAKPYSKTRQNSTAWMLEVIAAASHAAPDSRTEASAVLQAQHYQADTIHIPYSMRILGGLTRANTVFTDHSLGTRLSGEYPVSTVHSVFRYLRENHLVASELTLTPSGSTLILGE